MLRNFALLLLVALVLAACEDSPTAVEPLPSVAAVTVDDSLGPIFRTVSVNLDGAASIQVDYWASGSPRLRVTSPTSALEHRVFLPRLRSSTTYQYDVRAITSSGRQSAPFSGEFQTDSLPPELSALRFYIIGTPTFPLTMIEVRVPDMASIPFVVDQDGEIVWYRPGEGNRSAGFAHLANGDFVFNEEDRLSVVTPDHRMVAELPGTDQMRLHHDVITTPQNTILFLAQEDGPVNDTLWAGESIWEWDVQTDVLVKRWSSFDFLSPTVDRGPRSRPGDWLHANSLALGPRGNVLVSFFWLHEVLSIAADYESLEWRLGGPASTFAVEGGAMEAGQHTAAEISSGRVLLFDNGRDRPDSTLFSRALEIELDHDAQTARVIWEFRPQPDIYAPIMSSARRLDNGNTVVAFGEEAGFVDSSGPIAVFEVTPSNRILWFMRLEGLTGVYRATPLADIAGEEQVS